MLMYYIIAKKRDGGTLNREELSFAVNGCFGTIAAWQERITAFKKWLFVT